MPRRAVVLAASSLLGSAGCSLSGDLCYLSLERCGEAVEQACPRAASCAAFDRACTISVAPDGDDDSAGSEAAPFATLQRAADLSNPGDTICARQGTYAAADITHSGE